ncbi:extracellular calcium-sensing receptor-like [Pleurodeles waltl]|uniref:extracellular calcium-sensing receptor-like n=1 Tax=Pleurodeles waltl TaxID=8319 RepID=UPI00370973AC
MSLLRLLTPCLLLVSATHTVPPDCHLHAPKAAGYSRAGDLLIGATFPFHADRVYPKTTFQEEPAPVTCHTFTSLVYQWMQGMTFAIEEINNNPDLLPNITLGFWIYDSCRALQRVLEGTMWMLTGQEETIANYRCKETPPLVGVVGDSGSTRSMLMAQLLGLYRIPQISYFSTNPLLSDRNQFPSFFRTIPSDDFQSHGLAQMVMHFRWTWVGLLAEDSDYGQQGIQIIKQELLTAGACVAFSENIILSRTDRNAFHITQVIKGSTATAIVVFCSDTDMIIIADEMVRQNVTGKVLIASESWSTSALLSVKKYSDILTGTIGFAIHSGAMPGFDLHLRSAHPSKYADDVFIRAFWEDSFGCAWADHQNHLVSRVNIMKLCTGHENLSNLPTFYNATYQGIAYSTYMAVYAIATALHDLVSCEKRGSPFIQRNCADLVDLEPWQVLHYVKNVVVKTKAGDTLNFDMSGNPHAQYDVVNWQMDLDGTISSVKVGSYDSAAPLGETLIIKKSAIHWAAGHTKVPESICSPSCLSGFRQVTRPGEPVCCFQCVPCAAGEISNQTDSTECIRCPLSLWPDQKQHRCIRKAIEFLSYDDILGFLLSVAAIFLSLAPLSILGIFIRFRNTPVVRANNHSLSYLLLLSLFLCFLCSLVFIGYPTPLKCFLRQAAFGITFALSVSCILAKTIMVLIAFGATSPSSSLKKLTGHKLSYLAICVCTLFQTLLCVCWLIMSPPFPEHNIYSEPGKIIIECNEGSPFAFWCMLGYLGLLALVSFIAAFLARKLPDSFNEAQFITFSMLAFLSVWLAFIPAYLSTKGKYMVAMEVFAIQSSTSAILLCIFFPKCYIILIRPDLNTKEHLMGRKATKKVN